MALTLLPQVSTEDLNQTDFQCRDFTVHEDTSKIQLHLETDIDVGTVNSGTPPERESTIGNLVQTGALGVGQLLVSHRLFKSGRLLPEQTFPGREVCSLEQCVLENTLNTTKSGDNVNSIVVKLPEFAIVSLRSPPERIASWAVRIFERIYTVGIQRTA